MTLGIGVEHVIETPAEHAATSSAGEDLGEVVLTVDAQPGVPITVTKYVTYQSSSSAPAAELVDRCVRRSIGRSPMASTRCWRGSGRSSRASGIAPMSESPRRTTPRAQQAIRWSLFQVVQATWRAEGTGVPAKRPHRPVRAYLLGHRDVRPADAVLHLATHRTQPAAFARACCPRRASGARVEPARRALPWRIIDGGSLAELPGRHRPVPHQRRHRLRRSAATSTCAATRASSARSAPRSSSKPRGCGRTSGSTTPTAPSTSTA